MKTPAAETRITAGAQPAFAKLRVLQRIGRELVIEFLARFEPQLRIRHLALPPPSLPEAAWREALGRLLAAPEGLPQEMNEALFTVEEMATREGLEQLEAAASRAGMLLELRPGSAPADIALQTWLAHRELLCRTHHEQRMRRLCAFEFFGGREGPGQPPVPVRALERLPELAAALDPWFALHGRGHNTTRVELHVLAGEFWFLIRHGDTFTRKPKVEAQETEMLHFRPERGDVVVYGPAHDGLRINARTRGERDLYVRQFGHWLRGADDYFCETDIFTLEPLRADGAAALGPGGLEGIARVVLRETQLALDGRGRTVISRAGDDLFQPVPGPGEAPFAAGRLLHATFDVYFTGCARPRSVQVRLPNVLKLARHCDALLVDQWLCRQGFRRDRLNARL